MVKARRVTAMLIQSSFESRGDAVRQTIERRHRMQLPASATNFYQYDGGTFNGSIDYCAFDCGSVDDCWQALQVLGAPPKADFQAWSPSDYRVVMDGPSFYHPEFATPEWGIESIKNGVLYEHVVGDNRSMDFYAIDFDRLRVYYHHESGGFPPDKRVAATP